MRILHIIRDLSPLTGGPVSAVGALAAAQVRDGSQVIIASTGDRSTSYSDGNGVVYHIFKAWLRYWKYSYQFSESLSELVAWSQVVHIHTMWEYPSLAAAYRARDLQRPFLLRPCGMLDNWSLSQSSWRKRAYLGAFGRVLFSSPALIHFTSDGERLKSTVVGNVRNVVIENGVAESAFAERTARAFLESFPFLKSRRLLLFLGRVDPKKRPDIAIEAFSHLAAKHRDLDLVIAGPVSQQYLKLLQGLAVRFKVQSRVHFVGLLQGDVLFSAYRAAEVFLLPSMQENFGIAVVEAMAAGCPVVLSSNVDTAPVISAAGAGFVRDVDAHQFSEAIDIIISDPVVGVNMGQLGRRLAEERFTWPKAAASLNLVYESLCAGVGTNTKVSSSV